MPQFMRPGCWSLDPVRPEEAGGCIEQLRRFIGHDRLVQQTKAYRASEVVSGIRQVRLREKQPLIEAFEAYERATRKRTRPLMVMDQVLSDLAHVAMHYSIVRPTLPESIKRHQREKLIDLNGQLRPMLLEWRLASHFARTTGCEIAWHEVNNSGPEFIARSGDVEWEVECKWCSQMIIELLGQSEADRLADCIIRQLLNAGLRGRFVLEILPGFELREIMDIGRMQAAISLIASAGDIDEMLPGGVRLKGRAEVADGFSVKVVEWYREMENGKNPNARLYAYAKADEGFSVDPVELQVIGPKRAGDELLGYLWETKFNRAANQCSRDRGAVLSFELDGVNDPETFLESQAIKALLNRTFLEHRHVAAVVLMCGLSSTAQDWLIDYSVGAYLTKSSVTSFPAVAECVTISR